MDEDELRERMRARIEARRAARGASPDARVRAVEPSPDDPDAAGDPDERDIEITRLGVERERLSAQLAEVQHAVELAREGGAVALAKMRDRFLAERSLRADAERRADETAQALEQLRSAHAEATKRLAEFAERADLREDERDAAVATQQEAQRQAAEEKRHRELAEVARGQAERRASGAEDAAERTRISSVAALKALHAQFLEQAATREDAEKRAAAAAQALRDERQIGQERREQWSAELAEARRLAEAAEEALAEQRRQTATVEEQLGKREAELTDEVRRRQVVERKLGAVRAQLLEAEQLLTDTRHEAAATQAADHARHNELTVRLTAAERQADELRENLSATEQRLARTQTQLAAADEQLASVAQMLSGLRRRSGSPSPTIGP